MIVGVAGATVVGVGVTTGTQADSRSAIRQPSASFFTTDIVVLQMILVAAFATRQSRFEAASASRISAALWADQQILTLYIL